VVAVLVVLVMMAVVLVLVMTGSSCFTNMATTPMRVPNATNTNDATPIIMNFLHFTVQPSSVSLSSSGSGAHRLYGLTYRHQDDRGLGKGRHPCMTLVPRRRRVGSRIERE
jgi:hypothetical protein